MNSNKRTTRRRFVSQLSAGAALAALALGCRTASEARPANKVITVLGPVDPRELGSVLPHEHVLVDFIGAAQVSRSRYDRDLVFMRALPYLERVRALGCRTLAECTPAHIGRDPWLLERLARASGLHILTNTGYYGASQNKFLPEHTLAESAEQLGDRWIHEAEHGIEDSGVRPGFIKIGVDSGKLTGLHRKLVNAAAHAHLHTGLTIAAHTGNGEAALDELAALKAAGVSPQAFIWVHAQSEANTGLHAQAAEQGAWVEFDGISPGSIEQHLKFVIAMREGGCLTRVLVSHDAGWYHVGEANGGNFRSFDTLYTEFIPALSRAGFSAAEIRQITVENPAAAFAVRVRAA